MPWYAYLGIGLAAWLAIQWPLGAIIGRYLASIPDVGNDT